MSELRERIAAVLYTRAMSKLEWPRPWETIHTEMQKLWLADADAVIAEMDLGTPCAQNGCRMRQLARKGQSDD